MKEYILNARPMCDSDYVFISARPPIRELKDSMALNYIIKHYQEKTNIPKEQFHGKAFHSIRRMVGTGLILSDVPVTIASQVLGHQDLQCIQRYISLDTEHLKECALNLANIEIYPGGTANV